MAVIDDISWRHGSIRQASCRQAAPLGNCGGEGPCCSHCRQSFHKRLEHPLGDAAHRRSTHYPLHWSSMSWNRLLLLEQGPPQPWDGVQCLHAAWCRGGSSSDFELPVACTGGAAAGERHCAGAGTAAGAWQRRAHLLADPVQSPGDLHSQAGAACPFVQPKNYVSATLDMLRGVRCHGMP